MEQTDNFLIGVARQLGVLDAIRNKIGVLKEPSVLLQLRSGAVGGNSISMDMSGLGHLRPAEVEEFDFDSEVDMNEATKAFSHGGFIPDDKVFIVRKIAFKGVAHGDSNGGGAFSIDVLGNQIVNIEDSSSVTSNTWLGEIVVRPGEEALVFMTVSNSSAGEALITRKFEPLENHQAE